MFHRSACESQSWEKQTRDGEQADQAGIPEGQPKGQGQDADGSKLDHAMSGLWNEAIASISRRA